MRRCFPTPFRSSSLLVFLWPGFLVLGMSNFGKLLSLFGVMPAISLHLSLVADLLPKTSLLPVQAADAVRDVRTAMCNTQQSESEAGVSRRKDAAV
jgi:hypothetical protein